MEKFTKLSGVAAPFTRINVDTDLIIPAEHLKTISRLGLGKYLFLSKGEEKSGGREKKYILANVTEAYIGAIYLEAGIDKAREVILSLWEKRIQNLNPDEHPKDGKTRLQEYLQSRRLALPQYDVVSITGKDHAQTFEVTCTIEELNHTTTGTGNSRRKAEQMAARLTLEKLEHAK